MTAATLQRDIRRHSRIRFIVRTVIALLIALTLATYFWY